MQFEWIDFYSEFASKLLLFKNDRKTLISKIKDVYAAIDMKVPKLESEDEIIDIDPFTVFDLEIEDRNPKEIQESRAISSENGIVEGIG